jgi:hypothetical protein
VVMMSPLLDTVNLSAAGLGKLYCSKQFAAVSGSCAASLPIDVPIDTAGIRKKHEL